MGRRHHRGRRRVKSRRKSKRRNQKRGGEQVKDEKENKEDKAGGNGLGKLPQNSDRLSLIFIRFILGLHVRKDTGAMLESLIVMAQKI